MQNWSCGQETSQRSEPGVRTEPESWSRDKPVIEARESGGMERLRLKQEQVRVGARTGTASRAGAAAAVVHIDHCAAAVMRFK